MVRDPAETTGDAAWAPPRAAVYGLFFLSGATALVFEIVWARQFVTVFGNSPWAISAVLSAFMAGQGLGSWWFGRVADRRPRLLLLFALLEAGIGISALLIPVMVSLLGMLVPAIFARISSFSLMTLIRFAVSFLILCVPCTLMGGTLPVLSRFCIRRPALGGSSVSMLYGLNIVGATAGCWLTGFYLLQNYGLAATNRAAVGMCMVIGMTAYLLERRLQAETRRATRPEPSPGVSDARPGVASVWPSVLLGLSFMSGFVGLACEVLWIRYLVLVIAPTQYRFAGLLGLFLLCLGAGSLAYRLFWRRRDQVRILGVVELLLGLSLLLTLYGGSQALIHYWHEYLLGVLVGGFIPGSALSGLVATVIVAAMMVTVPALLMGMVFPLVCSLYVGRVGKVGRGVGTVYALNTLGSIAGSVLPVAVLIPLLGVQGSMLAVALLTVAVGLFILGRELPGEKVPRPVVAGVGTAAVAGAVLLLMPANLGKDLLLSNPGQEWHDIELYREGRTATVSIHRDRIDGLKTAYIDGTREVPTDYLSMKTFKLLGSLGPLLQEEPREVLVLALGAGITAGTALQYPQVDSLTGVDLVKEMREVCSRYRRENYNLLEEEGFDLAIEDARNYLLTCRREFPVIVCDSTHPQTADSWVLYTQEFYRTVESRLSDEGVFVQWVPVPALAVDQFKIILKTFQSVFPHTSVWFVSGMTEKSTYWCTTVLVATPERLSVDVARLRRRLSQPGVGRILEDHNLDSPAGLLSQFLCGEQRLREWSGPLPVNTDDLAYLQSGAPYSGGPQLSSQVLAELQESAWERLENTGTASEARELKAELKDFYTVKRHLLRQEMKKAVQSVPDNPQAQAVRLILDQVRRYSLEAARYWRRRNQPRRVRQWLGRAAFTADAQGNDDLARQIIREGLPFIRGPGR